MKFIYKNKNGHYYCGNQVSSNDINSAEIFGNNIFLYGPTSGFERMPLNQELRKLKLEKLNENR